VALKAESISKNPLPSIDIHASIDVADAQLFSYNRCNINNFIGIDVFSFSFFFYCARVTIVTELLYRYHNHCILHTFFNVTEGLQFSIRILQPNYVSIWI
jgi:hypothetical protein